jgi:chemotaxis protein MotB
VLAFNESLLFRNVATNKIEPLGLVSLAVLARVLNANPRTFIQVVGHCDNLPASRKSQDSWDFTALRAAAVVRNLVNTQEILPNRIVAGGKGEFGPAASNETSEGQSRNRRVEFNIFFQSEQFIKQVKQLTDRK